MRISTKGRYGLEAIFYLALKQNEIEFLSIKEIADATEISENYLEQLFIPLKRAKLVKGRRGAQGGYRFHQKPSDVTVATVLEVLEGDLSPVVLTKTIDPNKKVFDETIQVVWQALSNAVYFKINTYTIQDLIDQYTQMDTVLNFSI